MSDTAVLSIDSRLLSSLSKVFPDEELRDPAYAKGTALRSESFSFQLAYRSKQRAPKLKVAAESELAPHLTLKAVGLAPSELPCYADPDDFVLRTTPGLYPDPLYPLPDDGLTVYPNQWRAIWVSVDVPDDLPAGAYSIRLRLETETGETAAEETFELRVVAAKLPEQRLLHTEWFHSDCLATYYGVEVFSEEHWKLIAAYVKTAVSHGVNMLLTPLFTPPLDTEVGGERPTVQLVDVVRRGDRYEFGFGRLVRWVELCRSLGVRYFEFSHLFTQWGAKHAPKIIAEVDGERRRIFGWETDAAGEEYAGFLGQFLPELVRFIRAQGLASCSYFHVSDEPNANHLDSYRSASELVEEHLADFPIIDALSDYAFYERGLVRTPIPANNHIEPFLENGVEPLWTYYCCSQYRDVSNRFFYMPSVRNRIAGWQFYKFGVQGFLHWGYNFWYSQYSRKEIDPYRVTDAGGAFPSGDAFLVYPGEDGQPVESIRLKVFREALQDLRALELLESRIGRERALELLDEGAAAPLSFTDMPRDPALLLERRERINRLIEEMGTE
ncbi:DUF4091 domain-containing protein [Cohnella zeiphila]|uniref:DUF4091 domain-containing protein n=1 Tax=Cohnella zeiphila TaxID=2761120 RepID=A0A7X0VWA1_9BACL|nr:DUF4091 domain-containing protein [Cohnella zeiphila]MBB6732202.1 DUF4091 domain-containing protein [Cohnella zeiphila]